MVRLLLEASADKAAAVDCSDYGMTALHLAAQSGHTEVVRRLWRPVLTKIQPIALSLSAPASSKKINNVTKVESLNNVTAFFEWNKTNRECLPIF